MALFKVFKGTNEGQLNNITKNDGYAYYDVKTNRFYIDSFYIPTTSQLAIINQYITQYNITVPVQEAINYQGLTFSLKSLNNPLVLDRRPINEKGIIDIKIGETQVGSYEKKALQLTHVNGEIGYLPLVSPVLHSTPQSVVFYKDKDGELSPGDPTILIDSENHILTAPKVNGYIIAGQKENSIIGNKATAEGDQTIASGTASHAEGWNTTAGDQGDHAEGGATTAIGGDSHAEGNSTTASGYSSHAEGLGTQALDPYSHAEGVSTISGNIDNNYSAIATHAEGENTTASGTASHAEGINTKAFSEGSHAEGNNTLTIGRYAHAEGDHTTASGTAAHTEGQNNSASSTAAHAEGLANQAMAFASHAEGASNQVNGFAAHAEGWMNYADGFYAHAEGQSVSASGTASHAEGYGTKAKGFKTHAEGEDTTASGTASHAEGWMVTTSGVYSHGEGGLTTASGRAAHAEGWNNSASGTAAHAEGWNNSASGKASYAGGSFNIANGQSQHVFGEYNIADMVDSERGTYIEIVGNGTSSTTRSNARTLDWEGNEHISGTFTADGNLKSYVIAGQKENSTIGDKATAEGDNTIASGTASHAEGNRTQATGLGAHAEGSETSVTIDGTSVNYYLMASGAAAHAEGLGNTAAGNGSHAEGQLSYAGALAAHAEGNNTTATGATAHAEGNHAQATKQAAHAEGERTIASATAAHAEGRSTTAAGYASHAEGKQTIASATSAHVEGTNSHALGNHSHAEGVATIASSYSQHVFGTYNIAEPAKATPTTKSTYVEIVGNGTSKVRSDARRLEWNGNEWLAGKLTVGANAVDPWDVPTLSQVQSLITNNGAMIFKGTIGAAADNPTITALPASHTVGETYTVITAGSYAGVSCNIGDMIVCTTAGTSDNPNDWAIIPNNADGKVLGPSSSKQNEIAVFTDGTGKAITGLGVILPEDPEFTDTKYIFYDGENGNFSVKSSENNSTTVSVNIGKPAFAGTADKTIAANLINTVRGAIAYYSDTNGTFAYDSSLVWDPSKKILKADYLNGYVVAGQKENENIGNNSTAEGKDNIASGNYSHAEGFGTIVRGNYSHTEGFKTMAQRSYQHVFGTYNKGDEIGTDFSTTGAYIEIVGNGTSDTARSNARTLDWEGNEHISGVFTADGNLKSYVIAGQKENSTIGNKATAEGDQTIASGTASHAEGSLTQSIGSYAHTEGYKTIADGTASHAEGWQTTASGYESHTEGYGTVAQRRSQHVFGEWNRPDIIGDGPNVIGAYIEIVGNGTSDTARSNARTLDWEGNEHISGTFTADGNLKSYVIAGQKENSTIGDKATAEGKNTEASATAAHAEGELTIASGYAAHAEGLSTHTLLIKEQNDQSINSDEPINIEPDPSNMIILEIKASATAAHAEGIDTEASGVAAHAEGNFTIAAGNYSHSEGLGTIATEQAQHVFGKYNSTTSINNYVEIVGNGTSDTNRSNVRTLDWNGNEWISGKLTVNNGIDGYVTAGQMIPEYFGSGNPDDDLEYQIQKQQYTLGTRATSEGFNNNAHGNYSHVEGFYNTAHGDYSHVEGFGSKADDIAAHAEGNATIASGLSSHSEGNNTQAIGINSHAEGDGTIAQRKSQHVFGAYNIVDTAGETGYDKGQYIEIVGNGELIGFTGEMNRSNARTLDWQGNEQLAGSLTIGGHVALVFNAETNALDFNFI